MALEYLFSRLEEAPRPGVLDLGSPVASNVVLYARHGARITFADFYRFYEPSRAQHASARGFDELLPATTNHVDIIFAWDLLNYLSLEEIGWLLRSIGDRCGPGVVLLALVACAGSIPDAPSHHTIVDSETLRIDTNGPPTRPSPAYSEQALLRTLPSLTVKSRFQLRSSTVEYLFSWE